MQGQFNCEFFAKSCNINKWLRRGGVGLIGQKKKEKDKEDKRMF